MKPLALRGLIAAVHTPFTSDHAVNLAAVERQAQHCAGNGVPAVFVAGTTGESHSLTVAERLALTRRWIEVARGTRLMVIIHVGSNCLADAQTLAAQAQELGATAIAAMPPCYFKPRDVAALVACSAAVARSAPELPFFYYDIPALTGVALSMPEFLERALEAIPTLAGLKYSNPDLAQLQRCLGVASGQLDLAWGIDEALLAALELGVEAAVGSTYNFLAPVAGRLLTAWAAGDREAARLEQGRIVRAVAHLARYGYLSAAKHVMRRLGVDVGPVRLPLGDLTPDQAAHLEAELEPLGFWDWIRPGRVVHAPAVPIQP